MKVQVGDMVYVRGVVTCLSDYDDDVRFKTTANLSEYDGYCTSSQIVHVEPRSLQVGDRVVTESYDVIEIGVYFPGARRETTGNILAIHDDYAWVHVGGSESNRITKRLSDLRRAD